MTTKNNEQLFKLVFFNIVIFKKIIEFVRIYKKNERVVFSDLKSLKEYLEREYIQTIVYNSAEPLKEVKDLPIGCVLKEVSFCKLSSINCDMIPYGVEIINYSQLVNNTISTPFSALPSTIHTVTNAVLVTPKPSGRNNNKKSNNNHIKIPANITSISFKTFIPNISVKSGGFIIPKTIKSLKIFDGSWNNDGNLLIKGDIPEGITMLSIVEYNAFKNLKKGVLPNSIKEFHFYCQHNGSYDIYHDCESLYDFIPPNVEIVYMNCFGITRESNLYQFTSIKKLSIHFNNENLNALPNSLPSSITDLSISGISNPIEIDTIPTGVKYLELDFYEECIKKKGVIPNSVVSLTLTKVIDSDILPPFLTNIKIDPYNYNVESYDLIKMLSSPSLPKSLTLITLPKEFQKLKLPSIRNIKFL